MLNRFANARRRTARSAMCSILAAAAACSSGTESVVVPPVTSTVTLSVSTASGPVTAGSSSTFTVTAGRTGTFTGPIDLSVEGLPAGVTATVSPTQLTGAATSATVTLNAAATAAAGASTLTVRGKGTGVADATSSYALTVQAAPAAGGFTLAMNPTTLSVAAGANGTSTVTIARTGTFAGAVNLAVSGAPAGVTATLSSASVAGTTSTLTVAVAAGTAATTGTITITGSATGVANATATVALTTTVVTTPPSNGAITYRFCAAPFPTWFAVQDGTTGAWTRVTGTNNTYSFDLTNSVGGVAYAAPSGNSVQTNVWYGTKAEITARGVESCPTATSKTLTGTTANLTGNFEQGFVNFGNRATVVVPVAGTTYALNGVSDGAHDLVAGKSTLALNGFSLSSTLSKVILRRNLNPANNSAFGVLDFNAAEAFAPGSATATLTNLGTDVSVMTIGYSTANGTTGLLYADVGSGGASRNFFGVPAAQQIAGDVHLINATALPSNYLTDPIAAVTSRGTGVYVRDLGPQTLAYGPALVAPTVTVAGTAPYVRLKSVLARQAEYNQYFYANFQQQGATPRSIILEATAAWIGAGAFDVTVPDFTAAGGYDNAWGLKTGVSTMWILNATGWSTATPTPTAGVSFKNAQKAGQVTP